MKKIYFLFCSLACSLLSFSASATTINVSVSNFSFSPQTFSAVVGDTVLWTWVSGIHSVESLTVPGGAAAFNSAVFGNAGATFSYGITVAGSYSYQCGVHTTGMLAGFQANPVGVLEPASDLLTSIYPNPFKDKVTVKYGSIESMEVYNVIGEKVKSLELSGNETKIEIDFSNLPSGIYFYRTYKEGIIVETKRIVKAK